MANSKYEYVRLFERDDRLLPQTYIVIRLDGRGFHRLSRSYSFAKPNDARALNLMNAAATFVLRDLSDIVLAYGVSDEYSFVFSRTCTLFDRREAKLTSTVCSTFTAAYVHLWPKFFEGVPLTSPLPTFDARAVCYPSPGALRDYVAWRQVDAHINNLYNTTFWTLIQKDGMTPQEAEKRLMGTVASDKNEILFQRGINYNKEQEMYKKGSVLYRQFAGVDLERAGEAQSPNTQNDSISKTQLEKIKKSNRKAEIMVEHVDLIKDVFWTERPWILGSRQLTYSTPNPEPSTKD